MPQRRSSLRFFWLITIAVGLALVGVQSYTSAQKKPAKKAKKAPAKKQPTSATTAPAEVAPDASCVDGSCHTDVASKYRLKHKPVAEGKCRGCHKQEGKKHVFSTGNPEAMCLSCHKDPAKQGKIKHTDMKCLNCHGVHGSNTDGLLNADSQSEVCFKCHNDSIMKQRYKHGPAAAGACTMCHTAHAANELKMLVMPKGAKLCGQCHEQIGQNVLNGRFVHKPVEEGCTGCHNPHSGPFPKMLPGLAENLCAKCHSKIVKTSKDAKFPHKPTQIQAKCQNCHSPHAANEAKLLLKPQVNLCTGCHNQPKQVGNKELPGMRDFLKANNDWHGPIRKGNCAGCHQPHGSENAKLLMETYPPEFYAQFKLSNYGLCFSCHESTLVLQEKTRHLTGFRDGDRNLHFVHVNKDRRGRTCRACHEVHASTHPLHIRDKVPYGKWLLPINYQKKKNGGYCLPGCHGEQTYDRQRPKARPKKPATKRKPR